MPSGKVCFELKKQPFRPVHGQQSTWELGLSSVLNFQQILVHSGVFRGYKNILLRTNGFKDEIFLGKLMSENQLASKVEG